MVEQAEPRILIVGAGPTGLTAAVELARRGVVPEVIDRREDASTLSRAVGILPRSLALLNPSGVTERLLAEGVKVREIRIYMGRHWALTIPLRGTDSRYDFLLALAQDQTETAMRDALITAGGYVRYGTELTELRQQGDRVLAKTADGSETEYDYVIGADGVPSTVRKALGLEFAGYDLPETWSIADVDAVNWANSEVATFSLLPEGRVALVVPLGADRYRVVSNTEDALTTLTLDLEVTNIRREGQFKISVRQVAQYGLGAVYLAGDAAHCHSPVGGRGMNLGIADAAELAGRMVEGRLEGYSAVRHVEGAETIAASERARRWLTSSRSMTRAMLTVVFGVVGILPPLKHRIARALLDS